jgi:hypothetical protein
MKFHARERGSMGARRWGDRRWEAGEIGEMFWEVSTDVNWLSFDRTSGSGDASVVFTADPDGLDPGVYNATVTVQTVPPSRCKQCRRRGAPLHPDSKCP